MARRKSYSRTFNNRDKASTFVEELRKSGATIVGTKAALESVGIQPHHYAAPKPRTEGLPEIEAQLLAAQTDMAAGPVGITYAPTPSINPPDPRTAAAGYDPILHRLRVEWGDGGRAYNYYDVPPQIWDAFQAAPSPGRFINAVLNHFQYGPAEE